MGSDYRNAENAVNRQSDVFLRDSPYVDLRSAKTFGERLRLAREERGYRRRQGEFAKLLGIRQPSLSELESGESKEPSGPVLLKAAELLGIDPWLLLTGKPRADQEEQQPPDPIEAQLLLFFRGMAEDRREDLILLASHWYNVANPGKHRNNPFADTKKKR
jgi:transcriptional regulator with XRE-family HTH domain